MVSYFIVFAFLCLVKTIAVDYIEPHHSQNNDRLAIQAASPLYPVEMQALHDLYVATNGPAWHYRTVTPLSQKWNFTSMSNNPCTQHWQGLQCTLVPPYYHIRSINLLFFGLHGQLPVSIGALSKLAALSLGFNKLDGTLPPSLGLLSSLQYFDVSTNNIAGSIPSSIGNLIGLQSLDISINKFEGTIPLSFVNLTNLKAIDLGVNKISGTIPCFLAELRNMEVFHLYNNSFSGTIPECICNFTQVTLMDLSVNRLTGSIPSALAQMSRMQDLYLYDNLLNGTIPESIGSLVHLANLERYNNSLTGQLPDAIGNLPKMTLFALHDNKLRGSLPAGFCNMTLLQYVYINNNHFSGSLPACIWDLPQARLIDVSNNDFSGSIPHLLGNLTHLQYLVLHDNAFTGTLPVGLANLTNLIEFQVQNNAFSGPLSGRFAPKNHQSLTSIQINNNQFTGTLPAEIFMLPTLFSFVAVANCFHGSLPDTLCSAVRLENLILDGLSSATSCRDLLIPGQSSSYTTQRTVYGTVPTCLFEVHALTTLHLSGNGLTGTLPASARISNSLVDLTLSHNELSGDIPDNFQARPWFILDLSYNRIEGTLNTNFASDPVNHTELYYYENKFNNFLNLSHYHFRPTLLIANNRLSGMIPSVLRDRANISMLGTNVFSCKLDRTDLPKEDSGRNNYQCGSDSFDTPYYVWLGLFGAVVCVIGLVWLNQQCFVSECVNQLVKEGFIKVQKWSDAVAASNDSIRGVFAVLQSLQSISTQCAVYAVFVLLPLCCLLSHYYGTLTHQYAWLASAAYLSGPAPTGWLMATWIVLVLLVIVRFVRCFPGSSMSTALKKDERVTDRGHQFRYFSVGALFIIVNLTVVVGVNTAFVYIAIYRSATLRLVAQLLISLFKIAWNNVCSTYILRLLVAHLLTTQHNTQRTHQFVSLQVFVALLNNIVIPCLVVAVISPDCFYNVFDAAPAVESRFTYPNCVLDDNFDCFTFRDVVATTSFNPPFRYSYQCSSSLITYYSPAFVILCLMLTVVNPAIQGMLLHLYTRAVPGSLWHRMLRTALPHILHPLTGVDRSVESGSAFEKSSEDISTVDPQNKTKFSQEKPLFDGNRVLIIMLTLLGLLLTFGAVFPPLAAALFGTILATVSLTKLKVGRFLSTARELNLSQYVTIIEKECQGVGSVAVLQNSMWMLVTISCLFYTLFLFDTLGDAVGFNDSLWVLIVIPSMPIILYICNRLYNKYSPLKDNGLHTTAFAEEVEMNEVKRGDVTENSTFNIILDSSSM